MIIFMRSIIVFQFVGVWLVTYNKSTIHETYTIACSVQIVWYNIFSENVIVVQSNKYMKYTLHRCAFDVRHKINS
jgi:hypothetical protein